MLVGGNNNFQNANIHSDARQIDENNNEFLMLRDIKWI